MRVCVSGLLLAWLTGLRRPEALDSRRIRAPTRMPNPLALHSQLLPDSCWLGSKTISSQQFLKTLTSSLVDILRGLDTAFNQKILALKAGWSKSSRHDVRQIQTASKMCKIGTMYYNFMDSACNGLVALTREDRNTGGDVRTAFRSRHSGACYNAAICLASVLSRTYFLWGYCLSAQCRDDVTSGCNTGRTMCSQTAGNSSTSTSRW